MKNDRIFVDNKTDEDLQIVPETPRKVRLIHEETAQILAEIRNHQTLQTIAW